MLRSHLKHNMDNDNKSNVNSVSVTTEFSLTSFYGAKYGKTEILSESDSESNNYSDDNKNDSITLKCQSQIVKDCGK